MSTGSYTRDWDETVPADHTKFKNQPGYVRNKATDVAERLKSFFSGLTSGETTKGAKHLEFLNQSSAPSAVADSILVHAEDDVAPTPSSELFHTHETYGKQQSTFRGAPILLLSGLTNKDAATLNAGDVVVDNNGSTANSFKGSTTEGDTTVLGILVATKAADATNGAICHAGQFWVNVKTGDAGGKGNYIMHSDTKGKVKTTSVWQSGVFGELLTDISSNKAIARVFPVVKVPTIGDLLTVGTNGQIAKVVSGAWAAAWSGIVQQVRSEINTAVTCGAIPKDGSIPQNTEGTEITTVTITPKSTNNFLIIEFDTYGEAGANVNYICGALFKDSGADAIYAKGLGSGWISGSPGWSGSGKHRMQVTATEAMTFKLRVGGDSANAVVNRAGNGSGGGVDQPYGNIPGTYLQVTEIAPAV